MKKITFVIPSRNNLEFLQLAYQSIRNLETRHEILVLNDASTDGTQEWIDSLGDEDLITHHNSGPDRIGIVGMFDKGIEMARTEIIMAFHSDMVAAPDLDKHVLKHLEKGTVVSATRVEPPLHPDGPEKMLVDFGIEVEDFDIDKFNNWVNNEYKPKHDKLVTEGIFAPWCMYKEDFLAIGGHDELFAPQSKEDSDLFNRFVLNGYKVLQTWEGLVYHFTSRGSRFNKHAGGAAGKNSEEWQYTTTKNGRNFIRKWGHFIKHDALMKPIIPPKYDIGFIVKKCNSNLLEALEPWCNTIYIKDDMQVLTTHYLDKEQPNTLFDLNERIRLFDDEKNNEILVTIDSSTFNQQDFQYIQQLPEILANDDELYEEELPCEFELGNLKIEIFQLNTYEKDLICVS
jgi:glycosyltransferase involved in cell wall biosynthesis